MNIKISTFQSADDFVGIIIKKENNYAIIFDGIERFYFKTDDINIDLFDVIHINGHMSQLSIRKPIESAFDFKKYLMNSGVYRQIFANEYTIILNNPLNVVQIKYKILSNYSNYNSRLLINLLMFGEADYTNPDFLKIKSLGLTYLISLSGIQYLTFFNFLEYIFKKNLNEDRSKLGALIITFPFLILNFSSISLIRVYLVKLVNYISLKSSIKITKLGTKCLPYVILLVIDKYLIYSLSIIIPLVINIFMHFSSSSIKTKSNIKRKSAYKILFFLLMIPFYLQLNNMINIVNYVATIVLIPITKILFITMIPALLLLKLPIMDSIYACYFKYIAILDFKYLNINCGSMNQYHIVVYYSILALFLYFKEMNFKKVYSKIQYVYFSFLLIYFLPIKNALLCEINFINVGQGDSTLIRVKGENILIDTGGSLHTDIATNSLIPYLRKNKIYKIDKVYITHYDMDHFYALNSLKTNFIVGDVYDYNNYIDIKYSDFELYNINRYYNGDVEENKKSLVFNVRIYNNFILLMGDAPSSVELDILNSYPNLKTDILKVGHHGSNTSTCEEFIRKISPKEAVISCGERNTYKHPHKEVLSVLNKYKVKIRRTDEEGTITYKFFG